MEIKRNGNQQKAQTAYFVIDRKVTDVRWERVWDEYRKEPNSNGDEGRHIVRHEEKAEKSLSILVKFEPDHPSDTNNFYDYNIILSLDDLVEIIKALSRSIDSKSRPAIRKAFRPYIGELLEIALGASKKP